MSSDVVAFAPFAPSAALSMSSLMSASTSMLTTPKSVRASSRPMTSSASMPMPTPTCRLLPVQHDMTTPRARARAARLRANEAAERREDLAALITTPAQWALLRRSFASVKTEFADLDGMSWNGAPMAGLGTAPAPAPAPGRGRSHPPSSMCSYASASALALDDRTVRPSQGGKRRLSVAVPGWE